MPDSQDRRDSEFAKYDAMSTEELQQLLREDASKPVGEGSDTEILFYVMEVLAKRRKERNEGKSPEEALESFKQNYYTENTENDISFDSENVPVARKRHSIGRWMQGLIAAAAILVIIIGGSITAHALGFGLWEIVAKWTQETFHFGYAGETEDTNAPSSDYVNPCASLQEALDKRNITIDLVPTWIPDGFVESEIRVTDSPKHRAFFAQFKSGDESITIRLAGYLDSYPTQIEQSDSLLEIYSSNDINYYIFENYGMLEAVWINENYECVISGPLSIEEIKEMINSIGKG